MRRQRGDLEGEGASGSRRPGGVAGIVGAARSATSGLRASFMSGSLGSTASHGTFQVTIHARVSGRSASRHIRVIRGKTRVLQSR